MAANFESGFFVREAAWHGLGTVVSEAPTTADALRLAGLDWHVALEPMFLADGTLVPVRRAVVRDSDRSILGDVSESYVPAQPQQALDFMDALLGEGLKLSTAGSLRGGSRIWLMSEAPTVDILDDPVQPFLGITTSFDGSSSTTIYNTVVRTVCENTLDMGLAGASRTWKARHTSTIADRVKEAQRTLKLAGDYVDAIAEKAGRYAATKISAEEFKRIVNEIFGDDSETGDMSQKQKSNTMHLKAQLGLALRRPDLENFKGTAWHLYNAFGDFASHIDPVRKTAEWRENLWESFIDGNKTLLSVERILDEIVA